MLLLQSTLYISILLGVLLSSSKLLRDLRCHSQAKNQVAELALLKSLDKYSNAAYFRSRSSTHCHFWIKSDGHFYHIKGTRLKKIDLKYHGKLK